MLGRWRSEAYKWHVRTSPQELARRSKQLAAGGLSPQDSQPNLCNITNATVWFYELQCTI